MRRAPMHLLAPKPKPPSIPTRRAFLLAGGTLLAGLGIGGACGYAANAARDRDAASDATPADDGELRELRRLAQDAPIAELMRVAITFLDLLGSRYPDDDGLWHGADRIAMALLNDPALPDRRPLARWLIQTIERTDSPAAKARTRLIADLEDIR